MLDMETHDLFFLRREYKLLDNVVLEVWTADMASRADCGVKSQKVRMISDVTCMPWQKKLSGTAPSQSCERTHALAYILPK